MVKAPLVIGVKTLRKLIDKRIENKYDCNIIVTGTTGSGKSTLIYQTVKGYRRFDINKHLTYSRTEFINLIRDNKKSYVWADELIGMAFKRNHFEKEQNLLIEILTRYRNNYNLVIGALPVFFTLDKELIKLFKVHIQVISRGRAVLHLPREGRIYNDDKWDIKYNQKLEEKWSKMKEKNPNFKIPYHKYSTFKAYIYFEPMKEEEEEVYDKLKSEKRALAEKGSEEQNNKKESFYEKLMPMIKSGRLTKDELLKLCIFNNKSYSAVKTRIGQMLRDEGEGKTLRDFLLEERKKNDTDRSYNNKIPPPSDIDINDL